jgi:ankyrin repeat protein
MKHLLITTIAAVVLVGCGESQQSAPSPETKPVEPVAEAATPKTATTKAPDISIHEAAIKGNIEAVKQHLAAGTDVNAKDKWENTPLHFAAGNGHKEIVELLIAKGADVNAESENGVAGDPISVFLVGGIIRKTPLDVAIMRSHTEIANLLRKHGGKRGVELKAEGK